MKNITYAILSLGMLLLASCGTHQEGPFNQSSWTAPRLKELTDACLVEARKSEDTKSEAMAASYCDCYGMKVSKKWNMDDFFAHRNDYAADEAVIVDSCATDAGYPVVSWK